MATDQTTHGLPGGRAFLAGAPYARGEPPRARGVLRATPDDFVVVECMNIDREGAGEHLWLDIEKRGMTTPQVAESLAAHYGVRPRDVGYAGLKDRHAVTRQWFSLPLPETRVPSALPAQPDLRCLEAVRHRRKLRRGAHAGNRFELVLRDVTGDRSAVEADLERLSREGCPNYFGEQRFGRDDANLALARRLFEGYRMRRGPRRGLALSAARSDLFNAVLAARVADGTWNRLLAGEAAALEGSNSVFRVADPADPTLLRRLREFDIHPSGPLPGCGVPGVEGAAAALEEKILSEYSYAVSALSDMRVEASRRSLRLYPKSIDWQWLAGDVLRLRFVLPRGAFATVVLRELIQSRPPSASPAIANAQRLD